MAEEIINRVAKSKLKVFDLEDYFPKEPIEVLDISIWLEGGFLLKEKEFRTKLKEEKWEKYQDCLVGISCTTDAILPSWAMMLVASYLAPYVKFVFQGTQKELLLAYYQKVIYGLDFSEYANERVIVKGCSKKPVPEEMYVSVLDKIAKHAKSILFGEACSAVPVFKRPKITK